MSTRTRQTNSHSLRTAAKAPAAERDGPRAAGQLASSASPRQSQQGVQLAQLQRREPASARAGLPAELRSGIESLSGVDMSGVRVHRNSNKPAALQAHAYAQGQDIHLAPGQEQHLPHEAWHLVQQAQGRVKPTLRMQGGVAVNDTPALEREADLMGARALKNVGTAPVSQRRSSVNASAPLQRVGRGGHIAIGAAFGSVIPVLGTALGAYIGNRIYNKKQRRPARGQRGGTAVGAAAPHLPAFQLFIQAVRTDIQAGNFQAAADAMSTRRTALLNNLGLHLDLSLLAGPADKMVSTIATKNMYFPGTQRIAITLPATKFPALTTFWADDPARSRQVLFMALEEFMHAYQHLSDSFFSPDTSEYKSTDRAHNAAAQAGAAGYDYDEIDVMAAYQDWGEDVQALDYVNRYPERQHFQQWRQDRQTPGYRFKDKLALN
ncbi:DUF4157 domain-containing protein [Paucibacter sp. APW11]|uniref:DUF4157 domain-containing protein n=1 Tax=Roseateles aquae TaxID=3077235 RepID=A0ABU3P8Z3_9BURK|nr:DUF4157 domain-containing protein [Paucibacter sp. APW11]MDT8998216.1 DUF4157 domain-containing protein [Paucibacter sp. APW11]